MLLGGSSEIAALVRVSQGPGGLVPLGKGSFSPKSWLGGWEGVGFAEALGIAQLQCWDLKEPWTPQ